MRALRFLLLACIAGCTRPVEDHAALESPHAFRAMTWNIWHGGREDGADLGPARVVEIVRDSGADLVALQETYGSGELLAEALGFHFHPRGTNVSILSRHPVLEDLSVHEPFLCVGALVELPGAERVAFFSIWLPYSAEIWEAGTRDQDDAESICAACAASEAAIEAILAGIERRLADPKYVDVPVILAGDFNSMSHLDYAEIGLSDHRAVVDFPTSRRVFAAGFRDAWRETHPVVDRAADRTWTPRFPKQEQDRIDFVYHDGGRLSARESYVIDDHATHFPSDHAALVVEFELAAELEPRTNVELVAATYNLRHGAGMDDVLDWERTISAVRALDADLLGLQEIDMGTRRAGGVEQARELGQRLGMHAAFGAFMDYDGGRYGLAILSRHALSATRSVRLPDGNEPRVALEVEVLLPDASTLHVVNVHFDWVEDDGFRFAQARALAEHLDRIDGPWVLLGDFNDGPESRTLALFRARGVEAEKPAGTGAFTFPASQPVKELDYVFAAPRMCWEIASCRVVDERFASDHRPVRSQLRLSSAR